MTHEGGIRPEQKAHDARELRAFEAMLGAHEALSGRELFDSEQQAYRVGFYQGRAPLHRQIKGLLRENESVVLKNTKPAFTFESLQLEDSYQLDPSIFDEPVRKLVEARAAMPEIPGYRIVEEWPPLDFASTMNSDNVHIVVKFRYVKNEEEQ